MELEKGGGFILKALLSFMDNRQQAWLLALFFVTVGTVWWLVPYSYTVLALGLVPMSVYLAIRFPAIPCILFLSITYVRVLEVFPALKALHIPFLLGIGMFTGTLSNVLTRKITLYWDLEFSLLLLYYLKY